MREGRLVAHADKAAVLRDYFCFKVSQTASLPVMLIMKRLFYFYHHHTTCFCALHARLVPLLNVCAVTVVSRVCYHVYSLALFNFSDAFAKLRIATVSFVMSVRPHEKTPLPPDEFSLTLIFECFSKICRENSSFIKA